MASNKKKLVIDRQLTMLSLPLDQADTLVNECIKHGQDLLHQEHPDWESWVKRTATQLERIVTTNDLKDEFLNISLNISDPVSMLLFDQSPIRRVERHLEILSQIKNRLNLYENSFQFVNEQPFNNPDERMPSPIMVLKRIANRLPLVAQQIANRHSKRETLRIADEYDVQDLLHALLHLYFDDIRSEDPAPSYAGSSSRLDFLLKSEQIVIEAKMTRTNLRNKEVGEELAIDFDRYRSHPDCKTLFCLVYDPGNLISNPNGFERDLSGDKGGLTAHVIVSPKGH